MNDAAKAERWVRERCFVRRVAIGLRYGLQGAGSPRKALTKGTAGC